MSFQFKRRESGLGDLEYGARYLVAKAFDVLKQGALVRFRTAYLDVGKPPQVVEFTLDDINAIKIRIVPDRDSELLNSCLSRVDHYDVRGNEFEYESPKGKLKRKFEGEVQAVFFGFGRIYLTESKEDSPSNLHCMDYNLRDLWFHKGQGNTDPYDYISASNGNLIVSSAMFRVELKPDTGDLVFSCLNK